MPVDYEKIGLAIGKAQANTLELAGKSLDELRELLQKELTDNAEQIDGKLGELNKSLAEIGEEATKSAECLALDIENLTKQRCDFEALTASVEQRMAEVKDGEQGEKGDQGEQGEDGLDRPLLEPVALVDKSYPKSTVGTFNGGLWISQKEAVGDPETDPQAWHCMLDAMSTMSIDLQDDHTYKLSVRMGTGTLIEDTFQIPFPEGKGLYDEEADYAIGNIVTKGSSMWQAMDAPTGAPPGNGWKQILSAPRGKQGPAGKSIEGPQGKPGRNGKDAVLPDGFVERLVEIASERKAFEDGRSDAYAITSYRGYFVPDESYSAGDVINLDGGLLLCTRAGRFRSVAESGGAFEQMVGTPSRGGPTGFMDWQGAWQQRVYKKGDTVRDNGWTMVCTNRDGTSDRAAPTPVGLPTYVYQGTIGSDSVLASQVLVGTRFLSSKGGWIQGYRINTVVDYEYSVFYVANPTTNPVITSLATFTGQIDGWQEFALDDVVVRSNQEFDIVCLVRANDPAPVTWTGTWNYTAPNNPNIPGAGVMSHANNGLDFLRVNKTDDLGADQSTDLEAVKIGDTVSDGVVTWTVQSTTDNGSWMEFGVTPPIQSNDGIRPFTFTTVPAVQTTYAVDADYWTTASLDSLGLFLVDGSYDDIEVNSNAYGVDLLFQDASISPDWDFVSYTGSSSTVSQLTARESLWVAAATSDLELGTVTTSTNGWVELGRYYVEAGDGYDVEFKVTGKRTDAIGFSVGRYGLLVYRNGGVNADYETIYEHMSAGLNVRARPEGDDVVIEVDGRSGQDWNWKLLGFSQEIT